MNSYFKCKISSGSPWSSGISEITSSTGALQRISWATLLEINSLDTLETISKTL